MKLRTVPALVTFALLSSALPALAGIDRAGTTVANFLSVGSGAGILGMGGATLGWAGDLNAVGWNPAALGAIDGTQVVLSHAGVADQSSQEWAAVGGHFLPLRAHWALTGLYHGDGTFDGRDASGLTTGSFGVSSMALGATFARGFAGIATLGFGAKLVTEKLGDVSGIGGTFDAGLMVRSGPFGVGAAAQNVGGRMRYGSSNYPVPTNYGIGGSYEHRASGVRVALDLNFPTAYYSDVRTGIEWRWQDRVALRTGYRRELGGASNDPLTGPTFGVGAGARGMWFDYGYLVGGNGEGQHRLGLTFHPGGMLTGGDERYGATVRPVEPAAPPTPRRTASPKRETAAPRSSIEPASQAASPAKVKAAPVTKTEETVKAVAAPVTKTEAPGKPIAEAAPKTGEPAKTMVMPAPKAALPAKPMAAPVATTPAPLPQAAIAKPAAAPATIPVEVPPTPTKLPPVAQTPSVTPMPVAAPARITAPARSTPPALAPMSRPAKVKVRKGETIYQIAQHWGTSVPAIMMENNLVSVQVREGQTLKLPQR